MVTKDGAAAAVARRIFDFTNDDAVGTHNPSLLLLVLLGVVANTKVDGILHFASIGLILNLLAGLALLRLARGRFLLIGNDIPSGHVGNIGDRSGWACGGSSECIIAGVHGGTLGTLLQLTTRHLVDIGIVPASAADGGGRSRIDLMRGQSGGQYEESRCESHCAVFVRSMCTFIRLFCALGAVQSNGID